MKSRPKPELMAPAADRISLRAALQAGADAVYFGVGSFNMRANAGNFTRAQLADVMHIVRDFGARGYLTLNTLMLPRDLNTLNKTVAAAADAGVDAVIAWDFAAIEAARQAGLPVFISTQMSVANAPALLFFYRNLGIRRFVLARECSMNDIRRIRADLRRELGARAAEIELEVFAHGAMCLSVSGRCQLSQFHFGTSANRGLCRQPCRREFAVTETQDGHAFLLGSNYILSPKDLCTLPFLEQLLDAGVNSLKIEGRQRSPEYAAIVTAAYRRLIDLWATRPRPRDYAERLVTVKAEEMERMSSVFHRGFSSGFYLGKPLDEWSGVSGSTATHKKQYLGRVVRYYKRPQVAELLLEGGPLKIGEEIMIFGNTTGLLTETVTSMEHEHVRIESAEKGTAVGIGFTGLVRAGDKVYRLVPLKKKD
jgi:putative protease